MAGQEKRWTKPRLIVLARGTPEENVLDGCKLSGNPRVGPDSNMQVGCARQNGCGACQSRSGT